jgi:hypothetical protein
MDGYGRGTTRRRIGGRAQNSSTRVCTLGVIEQGCKMQGTEEICIFHMVHLATLAQLFVTAN